MLDVADLRPCSVAPKYGDYGALHVRWGKAKRGGPPRRRTVFSVFDLGRRGAPGLRRTGSSSLRRPGPPGSVGHRARQPVISPSA